MRTVVETGKGSGWGIRQGEVGASREALMPGMHWTQKAGVISGGVQQKGVLTIPLATSRGRI